ncbi:MAG: SDR family oxidoreductase [Flavobacteriales bacterium]
MNIFISGISKGIGRALVAESLGRGHFVIGSSSHPEIVPDEIRDSPRLQLLKIEWPFDRSNLEAQLTRIQDLDIDLLVNNAGLLNTDLLLNAVVEDALMMYNVNALFPLELSRAIYKANRFSRDASILNISSMGGFQGATKFEGLAAYSMSKAALVALTECMAVEWANDLKVNCLCLGAVQTEMLNEAFPGYVAPVSAQEMAKFILDFGESAGGIINGSIIPLKISDPK